MEFSGKKWQLRLLAGLLAVFVALYCLTDLFGGISAEDGGDNAAVLGESSEDSPEAEEEEEGIDPLADEYVDDYFNLDTVTVTINDKKVEKGETVYAKTGDKINISFKWHIQNNDDIQGWSGSETFTYASFGEDLQNVRIPDVKYLTGNFQVANDATAEYTIETSGSDTNGAIIGPLSIKITDKNSTFNHNGTITFDGKLNVTGDANRQSAITLGDWSCVLKNSNAYPNLNIYKETKNEQIYYENGNYYQNFYVTVNNYNNSVDATNVLLTDAYSANFAYRSLELLGATMNGSAVSLPAPTHGQNESYISVGTIPASGRLELSYRLKVDRPTETLSVSGSDFSNTVSASCEELEEPVSDPAWGWYSAPSVGKNGQYNKGSVNADGEEENGTIDWTFTVNPGVLASDPSFDFSVKEIADKNLTEDKILAGLQKIGYNSLTFTKADLDRLATKDANGTYTIRFTTEAPKKTAFDQSVINKVELKVGDNTLTASKEVTVPAGDKAIDKVLGSYDDSTEEFTLPWSFTISIPEQAKKSNGDPDPNDVLTNLTISDWAETPNGNYGGQSDRIKIDYSSLKVTIDGSYYTPVGIDPDTVYTSGNNYSLSNGMSAPLSLSLWYNQNIRFTINAAGSQSERTAWLESLRTETITVSYNMIVKSTSDDKITKIVNTAELGLTRGTETDRIKDDAVYQKKLSVSKGEHYYARGIDGASTYSDTDWKKFSGVKGWTVRVDNNAFDDNDNVIVLKDTLPEGYHLIPGVFQAVIKNENGQTQGSTIIHDRFTVNTTATYTFGSVKNEIFNAELTLTDTEKAAFKAGAYLEISYAGYLDNLYMNDRLTASGQNQYTFSLKNTAEVTAGGETATASFTTSITLPQNPALDKGFVGTPRQYSDHLEATYNLNVNEAEAAQNDGQPVTLTDTLGSMLRLVDGSVVVRKKNDAGQLVDVTNTITFVKGTIGEGNDEHTTLTFTLADETYYQIEYKVTSTGLLNDDVLNPNMAADYIRDNVFTAEELAAFVKSTGKTNQTEALKQVIEEELENSFGNKASLIGKTTANDVLSISSETFRLWTSYNYTFLITGEKIWPAGDTPPSEIILKLTTVETYVPAIAASLGKKTNETYTYYHLLYNGAAKDDEIIDGSRHVYIPIAATGDAAWAFATDYLSIEDQKGSTFYYTLEEEALSGYFPTYIFDPTKGTGMTTEDGSEFHINGSVHVQVKNQKRKTTGTLILRKTDNAVPASSLTGAEFTLTTQNVDMTDVTVSPAGAVASDRTARKLTLTVTESDGITLSDLPAATYTLTETKAPSGYVLNGKPYIFTVASNGAVQAKSDGDYSFDGRGTPTLTLRDQPTSLSVKKSDMTGLDQLDGAVIEIENDDPNVDLGDIKVSDTKGGVNIAFNKVTFTTTDKTAVIKGLPAGSYTLTETTAPSGYALTSEFKFTIGDDGKVTKTSGSANDTVDGTTITLKDEPTKFELKKTDKDDSDKLLAGAVFEIAAASSNTADLTTAPIGVANADGKVNVEEKTVTFKTTEKIAEITGLPAGDYTLTETTAPKDYKLTAALIAFTVGKDGKLATNADNTITVENELITGEIAFRKTDGKNALPGAEFTLSADREIDWSRVKRDGTPLSGRSEIATFTTGATDTVFSGLPVGSYTLAESKAPGGFLMTTDFSFNVTDQGTIDTADTRYKNGIATLIDEKVDPGTIAVAKLAAKTNAALGGAEFEVTIDGGGTFADNAQAENVDRFTLSDDKTTLTFVTKADVQAKITGLAAGKYIVKETKAPSGYVIDTASQTATLIADADGKLNYASLTFKNTPTEVRINKLDMTDGATQLDGAKLTITNTDKTAIPNGVTVTGAKDNDFDISENTLTFTTSNDLAVIRGLPAGDYTLTEETAPSGYTLTSEFKFTIGEDGKVTATADQDGNTFDGTSKITLFDQMTEIKIAKVDMTDGAKQLPGALLTITSKGGADLSRVTAEEIDGELSKTTDTVAFITMDQTATIKGLPAGRYELTETVAPTDYEKTQTTFSFTIGTDGKVTASTNTTATPTSGADITFDGDETFTVQNASLVTIEIQKHYIAEGEEGKPIDPTDELRADTVFGIYSHATCAAGDLIETASPDADGKVIFTNGGKKFGTGNYYIKEISSPNGYKKDEAIYRCTVANGKAQYAQEGGNGTNSAVIPIYTNVSTTAPIESGNGSASGSGGTTGGSGGTTDGSGGTTDGSGGTTDGSGTNPVTYPIGTRPNGTTTARVTSTTTTTRVTSTEPDEIETERTTARTTKRTTDTTTAPKETTVKKTTTTTTASEVTVTTTDPDGSGIDSNRHTNDDDNPHTGVAFTSLGALAAAGLLAVATKKKRK
ncbi:MAG: SpaA isopeptide-forming pilin-related protein [Bacteroides sp.]|nr:SpaA isopeptide-forming pilin-related protein [Eubacterium sp.]MCM1418755.1 SpaA isopeptide-forming pilin-related protein [Roseburia sp.]MCM1462000.1 SpaA isopeptide-forming pilin-related protein [Bacteroides sp.]